MAQADGYLRIDTKLNNDEFEKGLSRLKSAGAKAAMAAGAAIGTALYQGMNFESSMSKVQAISGATGEALQSLTEKAKEMGSKTVFSATQSAEAFQYMAMAGWKTEEMLSGIEGVMNLAAASGEDLGLVSDIVTDALTAFGLKASDSAHFADVLATASSNSNTNVAMMGETFKYVAPLAGSLGYSIEDTAQAIGLMANAGIKGSQAGTSLRSMLSRLSKPTKEVQTAMDGLGISMTDSSGKIKPLNTIMQDLRQSFDKLDDAQKPTYAAMLAGQEAMSGLLAIVNASDDDFNKLSNAIENADGTAKDMADTMNDNLKGQLTILASAAEGLALSFYDGIDEPLKKAVKSGISSIDAITASINSGKLKPAIEGIGELLGGIVDLLVNVTTSVLPPLISVLGGIGQNIGIIASLLTPLLIGLVTYKTLTLGLTASLAIAKKAQIAYNAVLNANPYAIAVAGVATFITALVKLGKAINNIKTEEEKHIELLKKKREAFEEVKKQSDENIKANLSEVSSCKSLKTELDTLVDANGRIKEGAQKRVEYILGELKNAYGIECDIIDGTIQKYDELSAAVDKSILKQELEAVISGMKEEVKTAKDEIGPVAEQISVLEEKLGPALEKREQHLEKIEELNQKLLPLEKQLSNAEFGTEKYDELREKVNEIQFAIEDEEDAVARLDDKYKGKMKTYDELKITYEEYSDTLSRNSKLMSAQISGDTEEMRSALGEYNNDIKLSEDFNKKSQENQLKEIKLHTKSALAEWKTYYKDVNESGNENMRQQLNDTTANLREWVLKYVETGGKLKDIASMFEGISEDIFGGFVMGTDAGTDTFLTKLSELSGLSVEQLKDAFEIHSPSALMSREIGEPLIQGIAKGAENGQGILSETMQRIVRKAVEAAKKEGNIHSPSRLTRDEIGKPLVDGIAVGIIDNGYKVSEAVEAMFDDLELKHDIGAYTDDEYYADMEKLRDKYIKKGTKQWWDYTKKIISYEDKKAEETRKVQSQALKDDIDEKIEGYERIYDVRSKLGIAGADEEAELNRRKGNAYLEYIEKIKNADYLTYEERQELLKKYTQNAQDCFIEAYSIIADAAKDKFGEIQSSYESTLDEINSKQKSFADKLKDHAPFTQTITFENANEGDESFELLTDWSKKAEEIKDYSSLLDTVLERGASDDFKNKLLEMGISEGSTVANLLMGLNDEEFAEYMSGYEEYQKLSEELAAEKYKGEAEAALSAYKTEIDSAAGDILTSLREKFGDIPDDFLSFGDESGENFEDEFMKHFEQMTSDMRNALNDIVSDFKINIDKASGGSNITNYSSTYTFNGIGKSASENLQAARDNDVYKKYAGI